MSDTQLFSKLLQELPAVAVMAVFAFALLKIVGEVLKHYHNMLNGIMSQILEQLHLIRENTRKCAGPGRREDG